MRVMYIAGKIMDTMKRNPDNEQQRRRIHLESSREKDTGAPHYTLMGMPLIPVMPFSICVDARKMLAGAGRRDRLRGLPSPAGCACSISGDELGEEDGGSAA